MEMTCVHGTAWARARWAAPLIAALAALLLSPGAVLAAGDADRAACPHEGSPGFRSYLPECRAYELVTPPYKEGFPASGAPLAVSAGGSRVIASSVGVFAETGNDRAIGFASYLFTRGESGWSTTALMPPVGEYPEAAFEGSSVVANAELTETMLKLTNNEKEAGPYVREEAGGVARFVPVGLPGGGIIMEGVSDDLAHVLFTTTTNWPGYTPPSRSLYEYVGTGNTEPTLVGVANQEALHGSPHVNEGALPISECATELGGENEKYNALSGSGETVFFTAVQCAGGPTVNELYARVDGERTVAISEPVLPGGAGGECDSGEPCHGAAHQGGVFEGADENGQRVFFLSEQPLVNGAPKAGMKLYGERLEGARVVEVLDLSNHGGAYAGVNPEVLGVARISEDGSRVYFVAKGVLTGEARGGGCEAELSAAQCRPTAGADNLYVYDTVTEKTAFVATLAPSDAADWQAIDRRPVQASACPPAESGCEAGRFLVFPSAEELTAGDTSTVPQLFQYDAQSEALRRASLGSPGLYPCAVSGKEEGFDCDGNTEQPALAPSIPVQEYAGVMNATSGSTGLALAADGEVFFQSRDALTPGALAGDPNVYAYREGDVYLIYGGTEEGPAVGLIGADESGRDVFFTTVDSLVPQDTDTEQDVYDARVEGGFPAPAGRPGCVEDACQGPLSTPFAAPAAGGSALLAGGGNLTPAASKPPPVASKPKPLTRAQKLSKAVKACAKKTARQRATCDARARKLYGARPKATSDGSRLAGGHRYGTG